jgi:hypothetical protein
MSHRDMLTLLYAAVAVWIGFALLLCWMAPSFGYDRDEENAAPQCQRQIWELFIDGQLIQMPDMDALECDIAGGLFDPQTRPFTKIECRQRFVCRQES